VKVYEECIGMHHREAVEHIQSREPTRMLNVLYTDMAITADHVATRYRIFLDRETDLVVEVTRG
jgi:hypothetical protein